MEIKEEFKTINKPYLETFKKFNNSDLAKDLWERELLIQHEIVEEKNDKLVLKINKVPFVSYPYEWCFDELKDAALLVLEIEKMALEYGFDLNDVSSYNIQFVGSKPIFVNPLSFLEYEEGKPWGAYYQFCKQFVAPLVLMAKVDPGLNSLIKNYHDGIPLDLTANILKHRGGLIAWEHIKLPNKSIKNNKKSKVRMTKRSVINIIELLIRQISNLNMKSHYDDNIDYFSKYFKTKQTLVKDYLKKVKLEDDDIVCDMKASDGTFSRIAVDLGAYVLALDTDSFAVRENYLRHSNKKDRMLPLITDLNMKKERVNVKCVLALDLIHRWYIANKLSFDDLFDNYKDICKFLIIEFVPKEDSEVDKLLQMKEDDLLGYNIGHFEESAKKSFKIIKKEEVSGSKRFLYLMEVKDRV